MATNPKPGSVAHLEIRSTDPEKTKAFYNRVFGWKFQDMPAMNYTMWEAPSGMGGGLMKPDNLPPGILTYILSKDINEDLPKISAAGGSVMMPKTEIPQMGWFAIFSDPTGMVNALYQTLPRRAQAAPRKKARRGAKKARSARGSRKRRK